jgi:hypothetical protein
MRRAFLCSILFVLACGTAHGQPVIFGFPRPPAPPPEILPAFDTLEEQGRYLAVKDFMRYPRPLSPVGDGTLVAMGDEIAAYFDLILERRPPLSTEEILRVLDMVHTAFSQPAFIRLCSDRNPEKSLALMEALQEATFDRFAKDSITAETAFLDNFIETAAPILINRGCNPGSMFEKVDLSVPSNDLPSDAIVDLGPAAQHDGRAFPNPAIQARFASVSAYMRMPSPLQLGDQFLAALGDDAAFFVYCFMTSSPPLTAEQMLTALDVIHKSFAHPMDIQGGAARRPEHAIAFLKILQAATTNQIVKDRIAVEANFLNDVPKKIYAPWRGIPEHSIPFVAKP